MCLDLTKNRRFKCCRISLEVVGGFKRGLAVSCYHYGRRPAYQAPSAGYIIAYFFFFFLPRMVGEGNRGGVLRVLVSLVELMRGVSHDVCFKSKLSHSLHLRPKMPTTFIILYRRSIGHTIK